MSRFKNLVVRLSHTENYSHTVDLWFTLIPSPFLNKWLDRLLHAQQRQDPISEPWAFYDLNSDWSDKRIIDEMNKSIDYCNQYEVMFDRKLKTVQDQDTLNYIHSVFELRHGQIDKWKDNELVATFPELRAQLSYINQLVHRAESHSHAPRIRCVWFDLPKTEKFSTEDYKLFTNKVEFGGVYSLYADVGKNLESLARDNDNYHHDFVPNIHYSADFVILFYSNNVVVTEQLIKQYYNSNIEYFTSLGYYPGDPRLTTGKIKLAQLVYSDQVKILSEVSTCNNIQSVMVF